MFCNSEVYFFDENQFCSNMSFNLCESSETSDDVTFPLITESQTFPRPLEFRDFLSELIQEDFGNLCKSWILNEFQALPGPISLTAGNITKNISVHSDCQQL
jgi:hypothetical protein